MTFTSFSGRRIATAALFALAIGSANASTLIVNYTDTFSYSGALVLTGTHNAGGWFDVTNVSGTWDSSPVAGPNSSTPFGATSDRFYTNPSNLPPATIDSGIVFVSGSGYTVNFYQYNFGGPGFATTILDPSFALVGSGAVPSISVIDGDVPEPATSALVIAGLGMAVFFRRRAQA